MLEEKQHLPTLSDIIAKQILFFGRSEVLSQWAIIILSLAISWLLSKWLWDWLQKTFPQSTTFVWGDERLPRRQYLALLLQTLDFPLISLILLNFSQLLFRSQNWTRGLLSVALQLMLVYLAYRFLLASLYGAFPLKIVRQYHYRLLAPLFTLFILKTIINVYSSLEQLEQISPFKLFNSAVSFGTIFSLIFGLYFWMTIVILVENLLLLVFQRRTKIELGTLQATLLLIRYFMIALGIVLILGYVGVNGTAVAAITGGLSVGIGFGLQQVVSNFVSGILLLFEGVLKPGDIINVEGNSCEVRKLGIRATTVRMLVDNSETVIPNQKLFTSDVTTYTGSDCLIYCSITVGVGYDSQINEVIDLLLQIAREHPRVLKEPSPAAFMLNFGDSSLNFELKFWLDNINSKKRVISDLSCSIVDKFAEHKIELPFPQRDIHLRSG
jgi:small-conductance mechanosensitive channel